jgi:hypothetical protein
LRSSIALLLLVSCGGVVSCGGASTRAERAGERADAPSSGQRLEAVFVEGADGAIGVFRHFRDTELELNCNFAVVKSGQ